jgi:hypothetical protein
LSEELTIYLLNMLAYAIVGLIVGLVIVIPVILWRFINGRPIIKKPKATLKSANIFYIGIIFFGVFSVISFYQNMKYEGVTFIIATLLYTIGLIAFQKGKFR